jgi:hypothetical protein
MTTSSARARLDEEEVLLACGSRGTEAPRRGPSREGRTTTGATARCRAAARSRRVCASSAGALVHAVEVADGDHGAAGAHLLARSPGAAQRRCVTAPSPRRSPGAMACLRAAARERVRRPSTVTPGGEPAVRRPRARTSSGSRHSTRAPRPRRSRGRRGCEVAASNRWTSSSQKPGDVEARDRCAAGRRAAPPRRARAPPQTPASSPASMRPAGSSQVSRPTAGRVLPHAETRPASSTASIGDGVGVAHDLPAPSSISRWRVEDPPGPIYRYDLGRTRAVSCRRLGCSAGRPGCRSSPGRRCASRPRRAAASGAGPRLLRLVEAGRDHRDADLVGGVLVVGDAEQHVHVLDLGGLADLLDDLVRVEERELLAAGDVDEQLLRALDAARQERRLGGAVGGLLGQLLAAAGADAHEHRAGAREERLDVGEVDVDEAGDVDHVADAAHAVVEDAIGDAEGVGEAHLAVERRRGGAGSRPR